MKLTLKGARVNANLRAKDVARALNISCATLYLWEKQGGASKVPLGKLVEMVKLYGISLDDLDISFFMPNSMR